MNKYTQTTCVLGCVSFAREAKHLAHTGLLKWASSTSFLSAACVRYDSHHSSYATRLHQSVWYGMTWHFSFWHDSYYVLPQHSLSYSWSYVCVCVCVCHDHMQHDCINVCDIVWPESCHMWHDSIYVRPPRRQCLSCLMTHAIVTWLMPSWHDSYRILPPYMWQDSHNQRYLYVTWLMPSWHDSYHILPQRYGVATISRLLKIIGPFCKRGL